MKPRLVFNSAIILVRHNPGVSCTIESISFAGVCLVGALTVSVGEMVQLLLEVDGTPIDVDGEVVRVVRRDVTTDRVAIAFRNVSATTRPVIQQIVQRNLESVAANDA